VRLYFAERKLPRTTVTTQATVVHKELWARYPVYYEITYTFGAPSPKDGKPSRYTKTAEASRLFYNALRPGDGIIITYPTADPHRSVVGPKFRSDVPWVLPLLGLLVGVALFLRGRRQLAAYRDRQYLARRLQQER
jgi:hypothetical protein